MTETSRPWAGITPGDSGPYTDQDWAEIWSTFLQTDKTTQGILYIPSSGNLEVSNPSSIFMRVATGYAIVDGSFYLNASNLDLISSGFPVTNPRIDVIVLEKDFINQVVRAKIVEGTEAGSPSAPAMTQTAGILWQIPLAQYQISVLGVISNLRDRRYVCSPSSGILFPIARVDLTGLATTTVSAIPPFFSSIVFALVADPYYVGGPGERDINLRMNGDTGADYFWHVTFDDSAGVTTTEASGATLMKLADTNVETTISGYGVMIFGEIFHYNNTSTSIRVKVLSNYIHYGFVSDLIRVGKAFGFYDNGTTKVSTLTFYIDGTSFGSTTGGQYLYVWGRV